MHPSSAGRYHRVILALMILAQFIPPLVLFSIGALAPLLRDSLSLSHGQIGFLAALFSISAGLFAIPGGWGADKLGIRGLLSAVQAVGGLALVATAWLRTYHELCLVMFLAGMTFTTVLVITSKAIAEWFPRAHRATAMGAKSSAVACAGIVAGAVMPPLALVVGWRQVFALMGGLMLASACCDLLLYRDRRQEKTPAAPLPVAAPQRSIWRDRNIWRLAIAGFFFGGVQYSFATYLALFLYERWEVSSILAASLLAQAYMGAAVSRVPYGWLSDRWLGGDCKAMLWWISAVALGVMLLPAAPAAESPSPAALSYCYPLWTFRLGLGRSIPKLICRDQQPGTRRSQLWGHDDLPASGQLCHSALVRVYGRRDGVVYDVLGTPDAVAAARHHATGLGADRSHDTPGYGGVWQDTVAGELFFRPGGVQSTLSIFPTYSTILSRTRPLQTPCSFWVGAIRPLYRLLLMAYKPGRNVLLSWESQGWGKPSCSTPLSLIAICNTSERFIGLLSEAFRGRYHEDELLRSWDAMASPRTPSSSPRLPYHALLAEHERSRQVALIIDEADTIPVETLEHLLWLANRRA